MFNFGEVKETSVMKAAPRKEGCKLTEVKRNEDQSFQVTFIDPATGGTLTHREFVPKKLDNMTDDDFKKNIGLSVARLAHITRAFVSQAEYDAIRVEDPNNMTKVVENFMSITKQMGALLKSKLEAKSDMTCALKVVLVKNKEKYYSGFPKVPPFVSTTNHPKEFTTNPQYDLYEIPAYRPDAAMPTQNSNNADPGLANSPLGGAALGGDF